MEQKITFTNSAGDKLSAVLNNPSKDSQRPIIIITHGFSSDKNGTAKDIAKRLQKHLISSFRFDFYGHGESEGKFEDITISEAIGDILNAINYLYENGYQKIGLIGSSFGGIASIMAASKTNRLKILGLRSPVSNYYLKEIETKPKKELEEWKSKGYRNYTSGDGTKHRLNYTFFEDFKNNDGYKAAEKIKIPTIIVHGDADEIVPYKQSLKLNKIIKGAKLHTVKGANHRYDNPEHRKEALNVLVSFVVRNI